MAREDNTSANDLAETISKDQAMEIMDKGCNGFIQKPFNLNNLSQKIKEVLDN